MTRYFNLTLLLGIVVFVVAYIYLPMVSTLGAMLIKVSIGIGAFWAFDEYVMKQIDTIEELKKGNVAYGLFLTSVALLILGAMLST